MIFHEIYGCYYRCVEKIIHSALENELTENKMLEIIHENAFDESHLYIMNALQEERWPLLHQDMKTPLLHHPTLPLTTLEKQWLKAMSLDPKIKLFHIDFSQLDDIEPLFTQDDFVIYDQYADGDPYEDEFYQQTFQTILKAIHEKRQIKIQYLQKEMICIPYRIEYSLKDDKMRLLSTHHFYKTMNISKITSIELRDHYENISFPRRHLRYFILEIYDERNALERVMTQFADMQKQAEQINDHHFRVKIYYEKEDETEMIIRILAFGPMVKVIEPAFLVDLIKHRLLRQKKLSLK